MRDRTFRFSWGREYIVGRSRSSGLWYIKDVRVKGHIEGYGINYRDAFDRLRVNGIIALMEKVAGPLPTHTRMKIGVEIQIKRKRPV